MIALKEEIASIVTYKYRVLEYSNWYSLPSLLIIMADRASEEQTFLFYFVYVCRVVSFFVGMTTSIRLTEYSVNRVLDRPVFVKNALNLV